MKVFQMPLRECDYTPDRALCGIKKDVSWFERKYGITFESFEQEGMGMVDAAFVGIDDEVNFILYRYRFGAIPDYTVLSVGSSGKCQSELLSMILGSLDIPKSLTIDAQLL